MNSKTAVVFGGTGFVGSAVVSTLARAGWQVVVPTRYTGKVEPLKTSGTPGQIIAAPLSSLSDDEALGKLVSKADAVINCIGILFEKGKASFDAVHRRFPETLARLCAQHNVSTFVHISALGADEKSASAYARSKAGGEKAVLKEYPQAILFRPSVIFGAADNFFNQFARMAVHSPFLPLIGGGRTRFQPVYVGNVADAVKRCLEGGGEKGAIYSLGGPDVLSFRQILERIQQYTGRRRTLVPLPYPVASIIGCAGSLLPKPPLTADQVTLLKSDNTVPADARHTLASLGITPTPVASVVPDYLQSWRRGGRWGAG